MRVVVRLAGLCCFLFAVVQAVGVRRTRRATVQAPNITADQRSSFTSFSVITPLSSAQRTNGTEQIVDATSNGLQGSLQLGDAFFDVTCNCGSNWTVAKPAAATTRTGSTLSTSCPTPRSYKVQQLSRDIIDDDSDDSISSSAADDTDPFNSTQVISFLPLPSRLKFENVSLVALSGIDGRATEPVLGTPGGDLAEFVLALQIFEEQLLKLHQRKKLVYNSTGLTTSNGGNLTAKAVLQLFKSYLTKSGPRKFFHSTSLDAIHHLQRELGHAINLDDPTSKDAARLLGEKCSAARRASQHYCGLMNPAAIGDRHLRLMYENPGQYLVRPQLIQHAISAFFTTLWDDATLSSQLVLGGKTFEDSQSQEEAVLFVVASDECNAQKSFPTVQPRGVGGSGDPRSVFVVHPQAVRAHRSNLAEFFQSVAANATQTSAGTSRSQATARTGATSFVQLHSQVDLSQHGDAAPDAMNATTTAAQTSKQVQPTPNDTTPTTTAGPNTTTAATTTPVPATTTPPRPATTSTPTTPKPTTLSAAAQKAKSKADAENAAAEAIFFKSLDNLGNRALQATLQSVARDLPVFQVTVA